MVTNHDAPHSGGIWNYCGHILVSVIGAFCVGVRDIGRFKPIGVLCGRRAMFLDGVFSLAFHITIGKRDLAS
jgi:hypothetical protein